MLMSTSCSRSNRGMKRLSAPPISHNPNEENNEQDERNSSYILWHSAFIDALKMELEAYRDALEFYPEYQLSAEPLRIDCIVIKKVKEIAIKKNIGAIFREVNLLEYVPSGRAW